ncbi:MAG: Peptidyl-prolyl cis-trans isomerase, partial [uncultured Sphingomonadaceae bacterium]
GALAEPELGKQPVLHLLRGRALPRQPVHRLGQCRRRHGACRRAPQGRAAAHPRQDREGLTPGV